MMFSKQNRSVCFALFTDLNCFHDEDEGGELVWTGRAIHLDEGNEVATFITDGGGADRWTAQIAADLEPPVN